ncbi:phosphotransferase [Nocardia tengchongensis]|uniref:phosphotransferase n=1 Tax=Nocardia tengchongensis TaxID=2055889 RepID=UPI0036BCE04C
MSGHSRVGAWEGPVRRMLAGSGRPELGWAELRLLGEGQDSVAVSAVDRSGRYVVRMPKGADGAVGVRVEARLLPELRVGVAIPRFLFTAPNPLGPGECCVYPEVPGEVLSADEWRRRGLSRRAETARTVAEFVDAVHAFPVRRAREVEVADWDTRREFASDLELVRAQVIPLLPAADGRRLLDLWDEFLSTDRNFEYEPMLIHADVSVDHLLVTGDRITGVIDFGDVRIGDPDYDLCYLWTGAGPEFVRQVQDFRGQPFDDRLIAKLRFWERSDRAIDILHAIEHRLPDFRDESVHALRATLAGPD